MIATQQVAPPSVQLKRRPFPAAFLEKFVFRRTIFLSGHSPEFKKLIEHPNDGDSSSPFAYRKFFPNQTLLGYLRNTPLSC
jgi:hypothetical protein